MKISLPINGYSSSIKINVYIWNKYLKKYNTMLIIIDTGASVTTISAEVLYKLGYNLKECNEKTILTASKKEQVKSVNIEKFKIENFELTNIEVYSHEFPEDSFHAAGVLGLNVLTKFDINFLFSQNILKLTPRNDI
ncbi:MAG: retroviral-like aspartic protease family protein [Oscillospiraceae bacterium]|nr:retroviral-like aspartic protease family protein [Oscillospiraceae bacterium]